LLDITLPTIAHSAIAARSRKTPRIANYLLRRIRDYAQMNQQDINEHSINEAFSLLGLDENGLSAHDINLLKIIRDKFSGGPVGVKNLAAATGEDDGTIEDVTEPYLIQLGLLERTPRGRQLTEKGKEYIRETR
jgi:Holliday junction DNA helicase RuvB